MTNEEFKQLLKEVFNTHMFMVKRDYHTINELMYCLRSDSRFKDFNFNISIVKANGEWWAIPTIDSFVNIDVLSIWFDDDKVEYEAEEVWVDCENVTTFDCITVYEREEG